VDSGSERRAILHGRARGRFLAATGEHQELACQQRHPPGKPGHHHEDAQRNARDRQEAKEEQEDEMPTEPDKQREAFIKMRQEIMALKEQQEAPSAEEEADILSQFRQRQVPQTQFTSEKDQDETLNQMQQVAYQAQMTAQQVVDLKQQLEDERLFNAFPELNPKNPEFKKPENRAFEKHVAGMYVLEQLQGKNPDLVSLAKKAKADFSLLSTPQKEAIAERVNSEAARLEQATSEARGSSANIPVADNSKEEAMRSGARRGDPEAIAALLKG
jgi:Fe-S-cluster formation regulator IscX/YfhJ